MPGVQTTHREEVAVSRNIKILRILPGRSGYQQRSSRHYQLNSPLVVCDSSQDVRWKSCPAEITHKGLSSIGLPKTLMVGRLWWQNRPLARGLSTAASKLSCASCRPCGASRWHWLEPRTVIPRQACTASCPARAPCGAVLLPQVNSFRVMVGLGSAPSWGQELSLQPTCALLFSAAKCY